MGTVKDYYDKRAPEYDDTCLGIDPYTDRKRPGLDEELRAMERVISGYVAYSSCSTSPRERRRAIS
jgi:hypothetical protein